MKKDKKDSYSKINGWFVYLIIYAINMLSPLVWIEIAGPTLDEMKASPIFILQLCFMMLGVFLVPIAIFESLEGFFIRYNRIK